MYSSFLFALFSVFFFSLCFPCSAAGGEIFNQCVADNDEAFTEKDVIRLARQILSGVAFLHRNNVVHLDLKVRTVGRLCANKQFIPSSVRPRERYYFSYASSTHSVCHGTVPTKQPETPDGIIMFSLMGP